MTKLKFTVRLIIGIVIITSCKKGAEDPFMSLSSRKSRISGEWRLSSIESSHTYDDNSGYSSSGTIMGNGSAMTTESENTFYNQSGTGHINEYSIHINQDGTWSSIKDVNYNTVRDFSSNKETSSGHSVQQESGTWTFLHKTKHEYRNKERVNFSVHHRQLHTDGSSTVTTYDDQSIPPTTETYGPAHYETSGEVAFDFFTYDLVMLKSKEMKWIQVGQMSFFNSYSDMNYIYNDSSSTSSIEEITWVAK